MMNIKFTCKHFNELSTHELYEIMRIRAEVFIVEQRCNYQDCDDRDQDAIHLMGYTELGLSAYCRLLPKGISYKDYCSIGRVLTKHSVRNLTFGKTLMQQAIDYCKVHFEGDIKIGAQAYLEKFYTELGFVSTQHQYLEDEIPHISMILTCNK